MPLSLLRLPLAAGAAALLLAGAIGGCAPAATGPRHFSAAEIVKGKLLYDTNGCPACHGHEGHGDGQLAGTLTPPPRDFRRRDTFKLPRTVPALADVMARGIQAFPTPMPAFPNLDLDSRELMAAYVLSIAGAPELMTPADTNTAPPGQP